MSRAAQQRLADEAAKRPGSVVRVRRQGAAEFYPREAKLSETDIKPMESLEFIFCDG